jgi:hypothetical protein
MCQMWADAASFALDLPCLGRLSKSTIQVVTSQITGYAFRLICFATSVTSPDWSNPLKGFGFGLDVYPTAPIPMTAIGFHPSKGSGSA